MMEKTLVLVKPDGVRRGLIGSIISRFERSGFKIVAMKMLQMSQKLAEQHYVEHERKDFYASLIRFILSGPIVAMVLERDNTVMIARDIIGGTKTEDRVSGTIRGDHATGVNENVVHGSDSLENAEVEIARFFTDNEMIA